MGAPVKRELDTIASDVEEVKARLDGCKALLAAAEASASSTSGSRMQLSEDFSSLRAKVLHAMSEGRMREALQVAITWELENENATKSLLADALAYFRDVAAGSNAEEPEDVVSQLDGRMQISLMVLLLHRSTSDNAELDAIERNLEWVFALLPVIDAKMEDTASS